MEAVHHRGVPEDVAAAVLGWLPDSELAASLLTVATRTVVVGADEPVAVAVVAEGMPTLSGAPLAAACAGDASAAQVLAEALAASLVGVERCEVSGPRQLAGLVASTVAGTLGGRREIVMDQRLMVTTEVVRPVGVPGRARRVTASDDELVAAWFDAFAVEALGSPSRDRDHWSSVLAAPHWRIWLWEVDGEPVSLVNSRQSTSVSSRIGPVFTPRSRRGRGYAAALTAAVAADRLDAGDERVTLYTDVTNATSNALYARIGFTDIGAHGAWLVAVS